MQNKRLIPYIELARRFLDGTIDPPTFSSDFFRLFQNEDTYFEEEAVFQILDRLFADVDAFCADDDLRDANDLNETELRERCRYALERLAPWVDDGGSQQEKSTKRI